MRTWHHIIGEVGMLHSSLFSDIPHISFSHCSHSSLWDHHKMTLWNIKQSKSFRGHFAWKMIFSKRSFFFKVKLNKLLKACDRNMLCSWHVAPFQPCCCYEDCSFTLKSLFRGQTSFTLWQRFSYLVAGLMYLSVLLHTPLKLLMVSLSYIFPEGRTLWILSWDGSKIS